MENKENKLLRMGSVVEISAETCADHILADYYGDVKRILFTECAVKQSGSFSDGGADEFPGIVVYDVLYLDAEGKPAHVSFTSEYNFKLKGDEQRRSAISTPHVSSYHVRSTGPRKFSAGATVGASVRCVIEDEISSRGSAFLQAENVQRLEGEIRLRCSAESERIEREFAERIERLDGVIEDEVEVVFSGALATIKEVEPADGGVRAKGELSLYALVSTDGAPLYLAQKIVPFEETVPFEGLCADMKFIPFAETVSASCAVNADEAGCELVVNAIIELRVIGEYNNRQKAVLDAFVAGGEVENEYRDFRYTELNDCFYEVRSGNYETQAEKITEDTIRDIPYINADARIVSTKTADGEIWVSCELRACGVASVVNEAGDITYTGLKMNIPFEERIACGACGADLEKAECTVSVCSVNALVDSECVRISYVISFGGVCSQLQTRRLLSESRLCEGTAQEGKSVTVYYPKPGETLFEVAKRFRTSVSALAAVNEISVSASADSNPSFSGVERLFIY